MKKFNSLLAAITAMAALLLAAPAAQAQYILGAVLGGTNNVAATTTNTSFTTVVQATKALDIAIQPSFRLTGAGTSAVVIKFDESNDMLNWKVAARSISVTANGTNTVSNVANFTVGGVGYLRLSQVENPNATAVTNLTVKYSQKRDQ